MPKQFAVTQLAHGPLVPSERAAIHGEAAPRLLYLATSRHEGGLERSSVRLASLMQARGASVRYGCHPGGLVETRCRLSHVPTAPLRVRNSGDVRAVIRLARVLWEQRIEIVHAHSRRDYVPAVLAVALARHRAQRADARHWPRLLLHVHQIRSLGDANPLSDRFFAWGVDQVVAVSEPVRTRLLRGARFPADRIHTIQNGIDLAAYAPPQSPVAWAWRRRTRAAWRIAADVPVIGMIGSLGTKGQAALIQAIPELSRTLPDLRVVLAGPEKKRGQADRLRRLAARLGVGDRVVIPGVTEDVPACMAAIDVLAHLPLDEAFGLTLVEAMASGVPMVATNVGGCRTLVRDGQTGYLIDPADAMALSRRLAELLDPRHGPALRAALGEEGRQAAQAFALETQVDQLVTLYREMLCPNATLHQGASRS